MVLMTRQSGGVKRWVWISTKLKRSPNKRYGLRSSRWASRASNCLNQLRRTRRSRSFSIGLIAWQVKASRGAAINLSPDDMTQIASDQAPQTRQRLATDDAARKDFAKNVRELLAVAEEARAKGIAYRPDIKRQMDLVRAIVISQSYGELNPGSAAVTDADIDALFKEREPQERFNQFIKDAQARNP